MLPNREGRFKATIREHGVAETGQNKLATFVCHFQLTEELGNGEWLPVEEDLDITGYFYLEKKDGTLNTVTIDALKRAFGWDGRDPFWLQDAAFEGHVVQVKLVFEEYNNRTRIKVQYVDAEDATPSGVPQADDAGRRAIATRLGAKFRANAGGNPGAGPAAAGRQPACAPQTGPASAARRADCHPRSGLVRVRTDVPAGYAAGACGAGVVPDHR